MSKVLIQITGDKKIIKYLISEFPDRLRQVIFAALVESLKEAETEAIKLAPIRTGALRRSINSTVANFGTKGVKGELFAGNPPRYAIYQEFGTYDKAVNPNNITQIQAALRTGIREGSFLKVGKIKSEKGIAPRLYLHGGFFNSIPRIQQIFNIKLENLVKEVNARGVKK